MLTDQYNRVHNYLRISLTDKCNLRCTYCNPIDLPRGYFSHSVKMSPDEIEIIAGIFVAQGIKKIRLTGGEPLVRKDAHEIMHRLAKLPVELSITTNGVFVHEFIDTFRESGIKSVNVSLDTLKSKKNQIITGRDVFEKVRDNIRLLLEHNFHVKINTVVIRDVNEKEIPDFVALTKDEPLNVRFIEFMPFAGNHWTKENVFSHKEILDLISLQYRYVPLHNDIHDTAIKYKVPGHQGTFAIISTMSRPFCSGCNRLRLTTDGKMKNCLFSKSEADILGALRQGQDIVPLIKQCVWEKEEALGGQFTTIQKNPDASKIQNRSMIHIGG
ncbi:MAG: GTP 3',8-cyclase MoaA [Bacteroidia bacterium]|nr:GTP 3',8-cyclase MoaA [Bacteroidia bacterium]